MRLWILLTLTVAILLWAGSLLADPFTSWGGAHEQVRPGVASLSVQFSTASLVLLVASAWAVFSSEVSRRGGKFIGFAIMLFFFGGTTIARLVWLEFFVLG